MRFIARLAATLGLAATLIAVPAVEAQATTAPDCKTVSADLVRPDSGTVGDWATDTFHRTAKVCHVPDVTAKAVEVQSWTYTVEVTDAGTFTTKGVKSFAGHTMLAGVVGSFHGSLGSNVAYKGSFDAPKDWGLWLGSVTNGNTYGTSDWVKHLWSDGFKPGKAVFGWQYETCNETLVNASAGNHGDITGLAKTFGTDRRKPFACLSVSFIDKCGGVTVVVLANATPGADATLTVSGYAKNPVLVKANSKVDVDVKPESGKTTVSIGKFPLKQHVYHQPVCTTPTPTPSGGTAGGIPPQDNGTPSLPVTGPSTPIFIGAGVLLLGAGAGLLVLLRRRRYRFTA